LVHEKEKQKGNNNPEPVKNGLNERVGLLPLIESHFRIAGDPSGTRECAPHYQECLPIIFHHPGSSVNAEATHHLVSSGRMVDFRPAGHDGETGDRCVRTWPFLSACM
jgi:hypothetical protein